MEYWKFTCTFDTERECMIRRLFGNHKKTTDGGKPLDVEDGDTLFLHRMMTKQSDRKGYFLGPFIADSDDKININSDAWNHVGSIRWQVRIDWEEPIYSFNIDNWLENSDPPLKITQYAQKFNEVQGPYLKGQLRKEGRKVIHHP